MRNFETLTIENSTGRSNTVLTDAKETFGFVPNLLGKMAHSPELAESYLTLNRLFERTSLTPTERQIVLLTASRENECDYCVAAHSTIATKTDVDRDIIDSIRTDRPIADPKLQALRSFTREVVIMRGRPSDQAVDTFLKAGYTERNVFDIILGIGLKTLSNFTNHIADTELDDQFNDWTWNLRKAA